jgi:DNA-binding PadR family transcriptional regulator
VTTCSTSPAPPGISNPLTQLWTHRGDHSFRDHPGAATTLTDILADVLGGRMAVGRRDGGAGQDVLRRVGEASVLILISLAGGPKHGYALIQDIKELAGVELGPGTLYGALDRLERLGLIDPLPAEDRRHPYRITAPGAAALRVHLDSVERVSAAGRLRLRLGGI